MSNKMLKINNGDRFGKWTVQRHIKKEQPKSGTHEYYECVCDCGTIRKVRSTTLKNGKTESCGCVTSNQLRERSTKHNGFGTPEYCAWTSMTQRCNRESHQNYENYGGRGIKVCDRWLVGEDGKHPFECFLEDLGLRPTNEHSLDRVDNNDDYKPSNCKWSTRVEQSNNRRTNTLADYEGETKTLSQWATHFGISYGSLLNHLRYKSFKESIEILIEHKKDGIQAIFD